MTVWIISRGCPTGHDPFNGIFEYDQAKALASIGHKVIMLCPDIRSVRRWRKFGWQHFHKDGVEVYIYNIYVGAMPYSVQHFFERKAFCRLADRVIAEHGKPDIAHAHFSSIAACAGVKCAALGIPLVVTEHSSALNCEIWNDSEKNKVLRAFQGVHQIIAVSDELCRHIKDNTGLESIPVSNIVDAASFLQVQHIIHSDFTFISVGNLIYRKAFDILLNALSVVHSRYPNAKLLIIGDGEERAALLKQTQTLGLQESVRFLGRLTREEMAQPYSLADAFVLASRGETFGVVCIEAMAAGLPVIATKCGGPESFVTPEVGTIIPVDDIGALAAAMESMIEHRHDYHSDDIRRFALQHFSGEQIARELTKIYESVLDNTK